MALSAVVAGAAILLCVSAPSATMAIECCTRSDFPCDQNPSTGNPHPLQNPSTGTGDIGNPHGQGKPSSKYFRSWMKTYLPEKLNYGKGSQSGYPLRKTGIYQSRIKAQHYIRALLDQSQSLRQTRG